LNELNQNVKDYESWLPKIAKKCEDNTAMIDFEKDHQKMPKRNSTIIGGIEMVQVTKIDLNSQLDP